MVRKMSANDIAICSVVIYALIWYFEEDQANISRYPCFETFIVNTGKMVIIFDLSWTEQI